MGGKRGDGGGGGGGKKRKEGGGGGGGGRKMYETVTIKQVFQYFWRGLQSRPENGGEPSYFESKY